MSKGYSLISFVVVKTTVLIFVWIFPGLYNPGWKCINRSETPAQLIHFIPQAAVLTPCLLHRLQVLFPCDDRRIVFENFMPWSIGAGNLFAHHADAIDRLAPKEFRAECF